MYLNDSPASTQPVSLCQVFVAAPTPKMSELSDKYCGSTEPCGTRLLFTSPIKRAETYSDNHLLKMGARRWNAVADHGVNQARHQIRSARTGGGAADAYPSGSSRVALGSEGSILLMANKDVLNRMIVKSVVERQRDTAGVSENAVHISRGAGNSGEYSRQIRDSTTWPFIVRNPFWKSLWAPNKKGHMADWVVRQWPSILNS